MAKFKIFMILFIILSISVTALSPLTKINAKNNLCGYLNFQASCQQTVNPPCVSSTQCPNGGVMMCDQGQPVRYSCLRNNYGVNECIRTQIHSSCFSWRNRLVYQCTNNQLSWYREFNFCNSKELCAFSNGNSVHEAVCFRFLPY